MITSEDLDNEFRNAYRKLHENFVCELPDYSGDEPNFDNLFKNCSFHKAIKAKNYYLRFKTKLPVSMVERTSVETDWRLSKDWLFNEEKEVDSEYFNNEEWEKYTIEIFKFFLERSTNEGLHLFYKEMQNQVLKYQFTYVYLEDNSFVIGIQNKKRYDNLLSYCNATRNWFEYGLGILNAQHIHNSYINAIKSGSIKPKQLINELAEIKANLEFEMFKQISINGKVLYGHQIQLVGLEPISKYLDTIKDNPLFTKALPISPQNPKNIPEKYHTLTSTQIEALYEALKGKYIASNTTLGQIQTIFDNKVTKLVTGVTWVATQPKLVYLLVRIFETDNWQSYLEEKNAFESRNGKLITHHTYSTVKSKMDPDRNYEPILAIIEAIRKV